MAPAARFELFFTSPPGLEPELFAEVAELGFAEAKAVPGGVTAQGDWPEVWRANLSSRGAGRVLVRIAAFPATHLSQLDKRCRRVPWAEFLPPGAPTRVEATCRKSRIYHSGAAAQRVETAIRAALGPADALAEDETPLEVRLRIEKDLCALSLDSSGAPLHKRGFKAAVGKAPMRETLAALLLRRCGYSGAETVLDPMCGSGTFVIEAAEIALGLAPGRGRAFAFERSPRFDPAVWDALRSECAAARRPDGAVSVFGFDRDAGAIAASQANAARAGVDGVAHFAQRPVSELTPPEGAAPGLVIVNPPYGERIGEKGPLHALHSALGAALRARFSGWRVGLVTSAPGLARAAGLPFEDPSPPIPHGPLKIRLYQTAPLP